MNNHIFIYYLFRATSDPPRAGTTGISILPILLYLYIFINYDISASRNNSSLLRPNCCLLAYDSGHLHAFPAWRQRHWPRSGSSALFLAILRMDCDLTLKNEFLIPCQQIILEYLRFQYRLLDSKRALFTCSFQSSFPAGNLTCPSHRWK